tara:strand:+ start:5724 stop:6809 length:1086 start_codon:yes stop_codon:yes gene_type:complete
VKSDQLKDFLFSLYKKAGLNDSHASICSWHTTLAEEWGVVTHGINLLNWYLESIYRGTINKSPDIIIEKKNEVFYLMDADRCHGQIATYMAAEKAIEVVKKNGMISFIGIENSNHFGMAGAPTYQISKAGYIGLMLCSTPPIIAPPGGVEKAVGSNPISIGFPLDKEEPFIFDAALSVNALNKIFVANKNKSAIPDFSYLNAEGYFTTDLEEITAHKLAAPLGGYPESSGYKGFGLALMAELLSACLLGGNTSSDLFDWNREIKGPAPESHVLIALKPDIFQEKTSVVNSVKKLFEFIKKRKKKKGTEEIMIPGEDRNRKKSKSKKEGLELKDWQIEILQRLNDEHELGYTQSFFTRNQYI